MMSTASPIDSAGFSKAVADLHREIAVLRDEVARLRSRQVEGLSNRGSAGPNGHASEPPHQAVPVGAELVDRCASDLLPVLKEVGQPLILPEILDELVHRKLSWRENIVKHALDDLLDQQQVQLHVDGHVHRYCVARP